MRKLLIAICLGLTLLSLAVSQVRGQDASGLSSRITRLEFDLQNVKTRLSQLESQASRSRPAAPVSPRPPTEPPAPLREPSLAEQFDNLAILTIELKQRVVALENRIDELEDQLARGAS